MGYMYEWLNGLFGTSLSDFLWGYNCATDAYDGSQVYVGIGLATIAVSLLSVVLFYYVIDHPRWAHRWLPWMFWVLGACFLNGVMAGTWTLSLLERGEIGDCLSVHPIDCWMFGLTNLIISAILMVVLSLIAKLFSKNNKYTPF